jgi:hypothetical protein
VRGERVEHARDRLKVLRGHDVRHLEGHQGT